MSDDRQRRAWLGRHAWWAPGFYRLSDRIGFFFAVGNGLLAVAFMFVGFWQLSAVLLVLMALNLLPLSRRFRNYERRGRG